MKHALLTRLVVGLCTLVLTPLAPLAAEPAPPGTPTPAASPAKKPPAIKYNRPAMSAEKLGERFSGGIRGGTKAGDPKLPTIAVLTPDHVALTSQAQPTLFWYQSTPAKVGFEITLVEPNKAKPLLKQELVAAEKIGICAISLARQHVTLQPGVTYRWSIALVLDPANRSKDLIASSRIMRVPLPAGVAEKTAGASPAEQASLYAAAGLWYDALQAISTALAADPKNAELRQRRVSLLSEGGLAEAAAADRN